MGTMLSYLDPDPVKENCYTTLAYSGSVLWKVVWDRDTQVECDCREDGTCPAGPPPLPPLEEFMEWPHDIDVSDCPPSPFFPSSQGDKTAGWYKPPGRVEHNVLTDTSKNNFNWLQNGSAPPSTPYNRADYGTYSSQPDAAPWQKAFESLPPEKQEMVVKELGGNGRKAIRARDRVGDDDGDAHVDYVVPQHSAVDMLLAAPEVTGREMMRLLTRNDANTFLVCTERAMDAALYSVRELGGEGGQRLVEERHEHMALLEAVVGFWKGHTPHGLERKMPHVPPAQNASIFDYHGLETTHPRPSTTTTRFKAAISKWFRPTKSSRPNPPSRAAHVCDHSYDAAMANVRADGGDRTNRYVGAVEQVAYSIVTQQIHRDRSSYLTELNQLEWPAEMGRNSTTAALDWREDNMRVVFGEAFPAVIVGMNYFAASLYTGSVGDWHLI